MRLIIPSTQATRDLESPDGLGTSESADLFRVRYLSLIAGERLF